MNNSHAVEVARGERFEFGKNWQRFLEVLDEQRIQKATEALASMLGCTSLTGKSFLDVGSGSGLSSLAAARLGARVRAFDYDPASVACTNELRRRYGTEASWQVEEGSVLDAPYLARLGRFDVVYSWGVLHHTGAMWQALENVIRLVSPGGSLFIAIYNDQGEPSRRWRAIKKLYNRLPRPLASGLAVLMFAARDMRLLIGDLIKLRPAFYVRRWTEYSKRGMSRWRDHIDWVGGLPFEVAKPEEVILFYQKRGFRLVNLTTCAGGQGCNQFVFERTQ